MLMLRLFFWHVTDCLSPPQATGGHAISQRFEKGCQGRTGRRGRAAESRPDRPVLYKVLWIILDMLHIAALDLQAFLTTELLIRCSSCDNLPQV